MNFLALQLFISTAIENCSVYLFFLLQKTYKSISVAVLAVHSVCVVLAFFLNLSHQP